MADFDLIGRVRLVVSPGDLKKINEKLNDAFSNKFSNKLEKIAPNISTASLGKLQRFARAYESFQERIRRSDRLTQAQKQRFLRRGKSLFTAFAKDPSDLESGFQSEFQLLRQAATRQQDINNRLKKIAALRREAQEILDPRARGGVTRSLNVLRKKVRSGDLSGFEEALQSTSGRVRSRLATQAQNEKARLKQAADANIAVTKATDEANKKRAQSLKDDIKEREQAAKKRRQIDDKEVADSIRENRRREAEARKDVAALQKARDEKDNAKLKQAAAGNLAVTKATDEANKKRSQSLKDDINERNKTAQAQRIIDDREVADSIKENQRREAEARRDVAALQKARNQKAKESAAAVAAREKEDKEELKAGQEAHQTREKRAKDAILATQKLDREREKAEKNRDRKINRDNRQERVRRRDVRSHTAEGFGDQSALAFKRFAAFSIAAGGIFTIVETLRQGVTEAVNFEQQLVKLAQVSNTSVASLGEFTQTVSNLSTGLGVSSADLIESSVTIRQAGFSLQETKAALDTLALTALSPSFNDLKNTTEGLIALKSQFNTSADDFKRQFGEINAVSKAFAVESEDIITAIRKSGGAFKVAGGQVSELIALFTAVRSTTRESADTIATGFRTIFARLQRPQIIDELKQFNIDLRDETTGEFVGPLKAIEKINQALGDIGTGDLQFARIVEQIGGIRQISKTVPLIQQFALAQRAANIELLGQNSLIEDAEIAQQSLSNRLTKTKENFLEFARELTLNDQFKEFTTTVLTLADALVRFGAVVAPLLPTFATVFALSSIGGVGRFAGAFGNRLTGQKNFLAQRQFANATEFLPFIGGRRGRKARLLAGAALPTAGVVGGFALSAGGSALADTSPVLNRRRFLAGRSLEGAGGGFATGIVGGAAIGTFVGAPGIGTAVGAGLGAAVAGLSSFTSALQEAQDALEESRFRPVFDSLSQSLSLINAGRISPLGQRGNLVAGFDALRQRRLTATGVERDQLEGDVRQTVESLLQFIQVLQESSKTMDDFNAAGGDEAIKFIAENSILSGKKLTDQTQSTIDALRKAENTARNLSSAQEKLTSQANLIGSFGAALADATAKANDMSERFNFVATNLLGAGAVGVQFRGAPGLQDIFSRPGQIADLGLLGGAANQITGFLGPQFTGLGQQAVATSDILRQLPSILSEFAVRRPSGDVAESIDIFVRDRLRQISKTIPAGGISLEPIIESIASSIQSEISKQGSGQAEAIQKILDAPATFVEGIVSGAGFEPLFQLFQDATTRFTERFNNYSDQFAQLTNREIQLRQQLVENLGVFFGRLEQVERVRNPRQFPIGVLREARLAQQRVLLGPNAALADNVGGILAERDRIKQSILDKEATLQKTTEVEAIRSLIEEITNLQGESDVLARAFDLAADKSDEIANKFDQIERIQLGRDQIRQGARDFIFGGRTTRNQLNATASAAALVGINPDQFFNPNLISDAMQQSIGDFLERFSEVELLPGLTGQKIEERILQRGVQRGVINPNVQRLQDLNKDQPNAAQQKLLDEITALAEQEKKDRDKWIQDERNTVAFMVTGINQSLQAFIKELRATLLQQQELATKNRLQATQAEQAPLQKQIEQFVQIQSAGGSGTGRENLTALELANTFRGLQGRNTAVVQALSDASSFEQLGDKRLINRFRGTPFTGNRFKKLAETLATTFDIAPTAPGDDIAPIIPRKISVASAKNLLLDPLTLAFKDLGLSPGNQLDFTRAISNKLADVADTGANVKLDDVKNIFVTTLKDAALAAQKEVNLLREPANKQFVGLQAGAQRFVQTLVGLPENKFNELSIAINELGDAKLDKVTEQFNNLNREAAALTGTLQGLTNQIRGLNQQPGAGPPAAVGAAQAQPLLDAVEATRQFFKKMTDDLKNAVNGNNGITQSLQNIPRTIELAANHKVEVIINGAQVLAQLQPGLEQLVITETEKAINKFAANNLPGVGSFA